jgi:hypothetical protein
MSTPIQTLTDQLTAAVVPNADSDAAAPTRTLKGVAKTLKLLAKQLTTQQAKQERTAQKAARPTAKKQRKALAGELLTTLRPQLGLGTATSTEVPKPLIKTVNRLAAKLIEQRRKQARQSAKATRKATRKLRDEQTLAPVLQVVRLAPAGNGRPAPATRSGRASRVASNGSLPTGVAKKELAATSSVD